MPPPPNTKKGYEHLERLEWPEDLLGPNYWKPNSTLISELSQDFKGKVGRVTESCIRFYQKVNHQQAPMISGDKNDPDAIHALQFAMNRQDELEKAIESPNEHPTQPLLLWLYERKRSLVKAMQAVVVAEEGEMYDLANKEPWKAKLADMTSEHVEHLRFIFRTVMARIDIVLGDKANVKSEKIQPTPRVAIVQPGVTGINFPTAPSVSFWKIDNSLMENSTLEMRQAALATYHQGRVMSAGRNNIPVTEPKPLPPVFNVTVRAMSLTIRSIDLVWVERQGGLPKAKERRLLAWLRERKNAAVDLRFAFIEFHLPLELHRRTVQIDNFGLIFVSKKGKYSEWGRLFLL
ncbi:hypothetical protein HO173_012961 [Letharia columbiana]|uniref:Uncharacterized protein n=1 Tax=Letharia columbiana TaxID=112416 RepID=A0A8H6CJG0_9LECA|nr:uncharacterized protein HO173_012961 [Letharia columbiana]KAF6224618.1 hypothetical protein HO173_012961 [Letharia columbiana]